MLVVKLLGQFNVQLNDQLIEIPSRPAQTLLAYLALHPGTAFRREKLAGLIWPDASESNARSNLRHALWRIRKALGEPMGQDYFPADDLTLMFNAGPGCWIDAIVLGGKTGLASPTLEEQVAAYQGELLPGFYDDWITIERERLQAAFESKIEALIVRLSSEKHWPDVIEWAEHWIEFGTVPEPAYRALMLAHARSGHKAKVKETYRRCAEALQREFGVEPAEETQELYQQLMATRPLTRPAIAAPVAAPRHNLPVPATPLIGRETELAEITDRLMNDPGCRLLTLVGPGGIGKTRLAVQAALQVMEQFDDGVFFVSFESIAAPEAMAATILQTLSPTLHEQKDPHTQLLDYARDKNMLLVLDNLEHLLEGIALIGAVLSAAPSAKVIVTSRERLHLQWEWLYEVQGLDYPREAAEAVESYSAVQLFLHTARRMRARFSLTEEQPHVIHICQLVEGLPLGLELAASWVRVMSCWEIAQQIERNVVLLATQLQDIPGRHRSARAVFEHSWGLLAPEEQTALMKLAAFPGGFRREAAEKVAGAPLSLLFTLVDKSLLRASAAGRYDMHSLLHQYVAEKLAQSGQGPAIETRLIAYYLDYARQQRGLYIELEEEWINLMACSQLAQGNGMPAVVLDYADALADAMFARGRFSDARRVFEWACEAAQAHRDDQKLAEYLRRWGEACIEQGDYDEARQLLQASLQLCASAADSQRVADAQYDLARIALEESDLPLAEQLLESCLRIRQQLADTLGLALVLFRQAWLHYEYRHIETALELAQRALDIQEQAHDRRNCLYTLHLLADLTLYGTADYARAAQFCERAIALCDELHDLDALASALGTLAEIHRLQGRLTEARLEAERSLALARLMGSRKAQAHYLFRLSKIDADAGHLEAALQNATLSLALCRNLHDRWGTVYLLEHLGRLQHRLNQNSDGRQMWLEAFTLAQELQHPLLATLREDLGL
jgi:predicted ATPase/DNA-binding SARP family transcriptional activator